MTTTKNKTIITQSRIVKSLAVLVALMMIVYLYCVNVTAFKAASYEKLVVVIDQQIWEISELESTLNQINRTITKDMADEYELVVLPESYLTFAMRNNSAKLTINE